MFHTNMSIEPKDATRISKEVEYETANNLIAVTRLQLLDRQLSNPGKSLTSKPIVALSVSEKIVMVDISQACVVRSSLAVSKRLVSLSVRQDRLAFVCMGDCVSAATYDEVRVGKPVAKLFSAFRMTTVDMKDKYLHNPCHIVD